MTSARAAGPLTTVAASNIEGFDVLAEAWQRHAPLGWDTRNPDPVADAALFLLSPLARAITGEILHVDGGFHALGAPPALPEANGAQEAGAASDEGAGASSAADATDAATSSARE